MSSFTGENKADYKDWYFLKNSKFNISIAFGLLFGSGFNNFVIASLLSSLNLSLKSIFPFKTLSSIIFYFILLSYIFFGAENGGFPLINSYINTPKVQTSNFSLCPVPLIISGDK